MQQTATPPPSPEVPTPEEPAPEAPGPSLDARPPGRMGLFLGFTRIGLSGFGGVMPFARRALVDRHRWLSSEEFTTLVGLCQFLPGANVCNLSIAVGARFHGFTGALAGIAGLVSGPFVVILLMAMLYDRYGHLKVVEGALVGIALAGAGLILATGLRMMWDLRRQWGLACVALGVVLCVAVLRWPLALTMAVALPIGLIVAALEYRRESRRASGREARDTPRT